MEPPNIPVIVGASVGSVLVLVIIVLVIILVFVVKRGSGKKP